MHQVLLVYLTANVQDSYWFAKRRTRSLVAARLLYRVILNHFLKPYADVVGATELKPQVHSGWLAKLPKVWRGIWKSIARGAMRSLKVMNEGSW